ncbi:GP46-like surface antigen, putative, partial [Bodo saltans]
IYAVHLYSNQLSGTIPNDLPRGWSNATTISIGMNTLTGTVPANVADLFILTKIQVLATGIAVLAPYASSCVPPPSSTSLPSLAPRPVVVPAAGVGNMSSLLGPETRFIGTTVAAASSIAVSSSNGAVRGAVPSADLL